MEGRTGKDQLLGSGKESELTGEAHRRSTEDSSALRSLFLKLFPSLSEELARELEDCKTVLDLGCGGNSRVGEFSHLC
jgi:hypothetical protein